MLSCRSNLMLENRFTLARRRAGADAGIARANQKAAALAPLIAELRATGITSLSGIAVALKGRGVRTPRGNRHWYPSQVAQLLRRLEM
jgi:recombinase